MADTRPALPRPDWATDGNATSGPDVGIATKLQPLSGEVALGYFRTGKMPARKLNWQLNKIGTWITWLADHTINAELGGAYSPDNPIVIGGGGLQVNTNGLSSFNVFGTGVFAVQATVAGATFLCPTVIDCAGVPFTVVHASQFFGPVTISDVATFNAQPLFPAGALAGLPGLAISDSGTLIGVGVAGLSVTSVSQFTKEIVLSGEGRVRDRITYAPDAPANFGVLDSDALVIQVGVSTIRIYTLQDAGASDGSRIEVLNYAGAAHVIHDQSGATLTTMAIASSGVPGVARFRWLDSGIPVGGRWHLAAP